MIGKRVCFRLKERKKDELSLEALREAGMSLPAEGPTAQDALALSDLHDCVMAAFEHLPDQYKEVYRLREIEGTTAEETAKILGLSVPNVKSRLHRARILVRAALDEALCSQ